MGSMFSRAAKKDDVGIRELQQMQSDLENLDVEHFVLNVEVVEANGLLSMDSNGLSDPYCKIEHSGVVSCSPIRFKTLTPKWDFIAKFIEDPDHALVVTVWDNDLIGTDDFIGEVEPDIPELGQCTDKWYKLKNPEVEDVGNIRIRVIHEWGGSAYWVNNLWDEILMGRDGKCPRLTRDEVVIDSDVKEDTLPKRTASWFKQHTTATITAATPNDNDNDHDNNNSSNNNATTTSNNDNDGGGNHSSGSSSNYDLNGNSPKHNAVSSAVASGATSHPRGSKGSLSTEPCVVEAFTPPTSHDDDFDVSHHHSSNIRYHSNHINNGVEMISSSGSGSGNNAVVLAGSMINRDDIDNLVQSMLPQPDDPRLDSTVPFDDASGEVDLTLAEKAIHGHPVLPGVTLS